MKVLPIKPKKYFCAKNIFGIYCLAVLFLFPSILIAQSNTRSFEMGLIYWPPASLEGRKDLIEIGIDRTISYSDIMVAQIPWSAVDTKICQNAQWIASLAKKHKRRLIIALDWLEPARKNLRDKKKYNWSFSDNKISQRFVFSVLTAIKNCKPDYILLGVEVNYLALYNPKEFRAFLTTFQEARKQIKKLSPKTLISVSFQYELLAGNDSSRDSPKTLEVLDAFGRSLDMVGMSIYPHLAGLSPENLGVHYFNQLKEINQPIGIFETAWPADDKKGESRQSDYLKILLPKANELGVKLVIWTSSADTPQPPPQKDKLSNGIPSWAYDLGLWTLHGNPKVATLTWINWFLHRFTTTAGNSR